MGVLATVFYTLLAVPDFAVRADALLAIPNLAIGTAASLGLGVVDLSLVFANALLLAIIEGGFFTAIRNALLAVKDLAIWADTLLAVPVLAIRTTAGLLGRVIYFALVVAHTLLLVIVKVGFLATIGNTLFAVPNFTIWADALLAVEILAIGTAASLLGRVIDFAILVAYALLLVVVEVGFLAAVFYTLFTVPDFTVRANAFPAVEVLSSRATASFAARVVDFAVVVAHTLLLSVVKVCFLATVNNACVAVPNLARGAAASLGVGVVNFAVFLANAFLLFVVV